jgi:hypothetical protein
MLIALKDEDANYTFQPQRDKIAFLQEYITVPTDSSYTLKLFKEALPPKSSRPKQVAQGHVSFGIEGPVDSLEITLLTPKPAGFSSLWTRRHNQDSLHYWYKPKIEIDSLIFESKGPEYTDTLIMRRRNREPDSLAFTNRTGRTLRPNRPFELYSSTPIAAFTQGLIAVYQDSTSIPFTIKKDSLYSQLNLEFTSQEDSSYQVQFLPGAITDFYNAVNDTLTYAFRTKEEAEYGGIELNLVNAKNFPYIVRLLDSQDKILQAIPTTQETKFNFEFLDAGDYKIQIVEDVNGNGVYDTGNYLEKKQPEKVINYTKIIDVRPSWFASETFTLKD